MGGPVSTVLKPIKQVADVVADPVTKVVQEAVKAPAVAINVAETPLKAATKAVEVASQPVLEASKTITETAADVVEPLERPVKRAGREITNIAEDAIKLAGEAFEEVVEKPVKKVGTELVDTITGMDKEDRRGTTPVATPEVTPEVVPDDGGLRGRRRDTRSKKPGAAGTLLEGGGVLYD